MCSAQLMLCSLWLCCVVALLLRYFTVFVLFRPRNCRFQLHAKGGGGGFGGRTVLPTVLLLALDPIHWIHLGLLIEFSNSLDSSMYTAPVSLHARAPLSAWPGLGLFDVTTPIYLERRLAAQGFEPS